MIKREKINIRGVYFDSVTMDEAVAICDGLINSGGGAVYTPNAEIVQLCVEQPEHYELINSADLVIPDGAGVVLASKLLGTPLVKGKVAGVELGAHLAALAAEKGYPLFILGGKPGVAATAAENLAAKNPGLIIAGTNDGYFKEDAPIIEMIRESGAKIVFVCIGVPRQEKWIRAHRSELHGMLLCGLGGSADIYAGVAKRAPKLFIKLGCEWLWRLIREPKRIGRMMKLPKFVLGTIFRGKKDSRPRQL